MKFTNAPHWQHLLFIFCIALSLSISLQLPFSSIAADDPAMDEDQFFTLSNGTNLRSFGGPEVRKLLSRQKGGGVSFGAKQEKQYCRLKKSAQIQLKAKFDEMKLVISLFYNGLPFPLRNE